MGGVIRIIIIIIIITEEVSLSQAFNDFVHLCLYYVVIKAIVGVQEAGNINLEYE